MARRALRKGRNRCAEHVGEHSDVTRGLEFLDIRARNLKNFRACAAHLSTVALYTKVRPIGRAMGLTFILYNSGAEGAEKILRYINSNFNDFLHIFCVL